MSLLLLVASLLFGTQPCEPGTLTLYEDMSYVIVPSESALVCNIEEEGSSLYDTPININYWQLTLVTDGLVLVEHITYTMGAPFPESITNESYYFVVTDAVVPYESVRYDSVRLGDNIYSL